MSAIPDGSKPGAGSWILELRTRLEQPSPRPLHTGDDEGDKTILAVLVGLFVDAGELWVMLTEESEDDAFAAARIGFASRGYRAADSPFQAIAKAAEQVFGLLSSEVLHIGELDAVALPDRRQILPVVAALPTPAGEASPLERPGVFGLPLSAIANPRMIEERTMLIGDKEIPEPVLHVGRHRLFGPVSWILGNLLQRLG